MTTRVYESYELFRRASAGLGSLARITGLLLFVFGAITLFQRPAHAGFLLNGDVSPCANAYYGIGEKIDYKKAYACFKKHGIWEFQIIMQFNGQGVPRNPAKAKEILDKWRKIDPGGVKSLDGQALSRTMEKDEETGTGRKKGISFCNDVAMTTPYVDFCSNIETELKQERFNRQTSEINRSLDAPGRVLWKSILATFNAYKAAESDRLFTQYSCCTIRAVAANGQASMVRQQFLTLMDEAVGRHSLKKATIKELSTAKASVSTAYKKSIEGFVDQYSYLDDSNSTPDMRSEYADDLASYKTDIRKSQKLWEKLTLQCEDLVRHIYHEEREGASYANGIGVLLSENRVKALQYDPVGD